MKSETTSTADASGRDAPNVIIFPPALYLGTLLLGQLLNLFWSWPILLASRPAFWLRLAGAGVAVSGISLILWGRTTMVRAGTNVFPTKPTLVIVTAGPFCFTRNPLYLGNAMVYLGLTLVFNSAWMLLLFVPMVRVLRWAIIHREERYLQAKFGLLYLSYKARVPRWL